MNRTFLHESLARSPITLDTLRSMSIFVCGAGALGANITENLVRMGAENITVVDKDRIEQHNLSTQPYFKTDIGSFKAQTLANNLFRAIGTKVKFKNEELTINNYTKLGLGGSFIIDCFDNSSSRYLLWEKAQVNNQTCLHVGLNDRYAEVVWNEAYVVPNDVGPDNCDYPLSRTIVMLASSVATETILQNIETGKRNNYSITLNDLQVRKH